MASLELLPIKTHKSSHTFNMDKSSANHKAKFGWDGRCARPEEKTRLKQTSPGRTDDRGYKVPEVEGQMMLHPLIVL